jgi:hypothetical protein
MRKMLVFIVAFGASVYAKAEKEDSAEAAPHQDMLTPAYYLAAEDDPFRAEVDRFISRCRKEVFHHPLLNETGKMPPFKVHNWGTFGAGKPPGRNMQHHPAADFKIDGGETKVSLYACYDGLVTTFKDVPKYRHYLAITKDVFAEDGKVLGKLVTIYGHIDLDLNEADGLSLEGKRVKKGDLVSRHLYSGTMGGPHLHFEVRYYKVGEQGDEEFYGFQFPGSKDTNLTEASSGPWPYGYWNPNIGYGYADPKNHGVDY